MNPPERPPRILVVDDDEDGRLLVAQILQDAGYEVDGAADGADALERIGTSRPDLVILDLQMPFVDGWDVLERIRSVPAPPPVVVVTARGDYETFTRGVREGALGHLIKPFRFEELLTVCRKILRASDGAVPPPATERRRNPRRVLMVEVKVLSAGAPRPLLGELANLSEGGLQVDLEQPLEVGTAVRVVFHIPGAGAAHSLEGQVRWRQAAGRGFTHGLILDDFTAEVEGQLREMLGT